jgi:hypothetical protein
MNLALFLPPAKTSLSRHQMNAVTDPYKDMDARSFSFRLCQTYTGEWLKVYGNATILSNGTLAASVDKIYNESRKQFEYWPFNQEIKDAVEARAAEYFLEEVNHSFCKHSIVNHSICF